MSTIRLEPNKEDGIGFQINEISRVIEWVNIKGDSEICFDKIHFVHPTIILGISALYSSLSEKGINCTFKNINNDLQGYLSTIGFPNGIYPDLDPNWSYKLENFKHKNYLPIINFPTLKNQETDNFRNSVLSKVNEIIAFKLGLKISQIGALSYFISELTDNIVDHSGVARGKIMVQYFPNKRYLEICIIDIGKGILGSYVDSGKFFNISNDREAINGAINGKSTKSEERGFGIPTSLKLIVEGLNGKICLVSGKAMLVNEKIIDYTSFWKGTLLSIKIPNADSVNTVDYTKFI